MGTGNFVVHSFCFDTVEIFCLCRIREPTGDLCDPFIFVTALFESQFHISLAFVSELHRWHIRLK